MRRVCIFWKKVWGLLVFLDTFAEEFGHVISSRILRVKVSVVYLYPRGCVGNTDDYSPLFPEQLRKNMHSIGTLLSLFWVKSTTSLADINVGKTKLAQIVIPYPKLLIIVCSGFLLRMVAFTLLATALGMIFPYTLSIAIWPAFGVYVYLVLHKAKDGDIFLARKYLVGYLKYIADRSPNKSLSKMIVAFASKLEEENSSTQI